MTGIERLRKLTDATLGYVRVASVTPHDYEYENDVEWDERMHLSELLASIYSQINREQDAMVADSPYEALPPEDREAIAWVREHGGLDAVRSEWSSRVPYDKHEQRRHRLLGHIAECETALRRRNQHIKELGHRVSDLTAENAELRKRAMPEGMEWPRFEDGEPVRFGEEAMGFSHKPPFVVDHVTLFDGGEVTVCAEVDLDSGSVENFVRVLPGERVKRPPIPAADGEPLREGETVWGINGATYRVTGLHDGEVFARHIGGSFGAEVESAGGSGLYRLRAEQLTHERPESKCRDCAHWQKDPTADNMGVCWFFYHEYEGEDCYAARRADIGACEEFMPRASALTERERGE